MRPGRRPEFTDGFELGVLDPGRWIAAYLPHWSSRERAAARYRFDAGRLVLEIAADQEPWNPEADGDLRVSSIQTGVFAGPVGSPIGQHRFRSDLVVREAQPPARLYTPRFGRIQIRMSAVAHPDAMVALWMIGYEDEPERSAEICVCEVFGRDIGRARVRIGMGIHPFGDPQLADDFGQVDLKVDATAAHEYAVDWGPGRVDYLVDGRVVKTSGQAPDYPMQLMVGLYAFARPAAGDPLRFVVDHVRGFAPPGGRAA
ncbi:MAG TPA: glycoside hydrolase family 16 protein [Candidatus Deferrimicrobium sp.]|nr:glycoside hydrolase family 16 protein [Candidatus Deferrimicrobium sp.]